MSPNAIGHHKLKYGRKFIVSCFVIYPPPPVGNLDIAFDGVRV
jgi:hypothetical protein